MTITKAPIAVSGGRLGHSPPNTSHDPPASIPLAKEKGPRRGSAEPGPTDGKTADDPFLKALAGDLKGREDHRQVCQRCPPPACQPPACAPPAHCPVTPITFGTGRDAPGLRAWRAASKGGAVLRPEHLRRALTLASGVQHRPRAGAGHRRAVHSRRASGMLSNGSCLPCRPQPVLDQYATPFNPPPPDRNPLADTADKPSKRGFCATQLEKKII